MRLGDLKPPVLRTGIAIPGFPQHAVAVQYATEHRCGVVVRGRGLSDAISGTDPLKDRLPLQARCRAPADAIRVSVSSTLSVSHAMLADGHTTGSH